MTLRNLLPIAACLAFSVAAQAAHSDEILGTWSQDNGRESKVEITKCGDRYCGTIIWMRMPRTDDKNVDAGLRHRPLVATKIMNNYKFEGGATWAGGRVYLPERGRLVEATFVMLNHKELEIHEGKGPSPKMAIWRRVAE